MAFKEAYPERLAEWGNEVFVSLGHDPDERRTAIEEAVRNGLMTPARAAGLLPEPESESYWGNWGAVAEAKKLLETDERTTVD